MESMTKSSSRISSAVYGVLKKSYLVSALQKYIFWGRIRPGNTSPFRTKGQMAYFML